jgi:hypothetical protein
MRNLFLTFSLLIYPIIAFSQPWLDLLPRNKSNNELTLKDYQKAFYSYWEPYKLNKGKYIDTHGIEKKAQGWKQFKRWEWYMESQVDPKTGVFPKINTLQGEINSGSTNNKSDLNSWKSLGADYSDGGYAGIGRLNCIAFHPTDLNTFWVGAPSGGLWKTTDGGISWACLTDQNNIMGVSCILIPSDYSSSNTIFISTGDRDVFDNRSIGILKSTDEGLSWVQTGLSFELHQRGMVTQMVMNPDNNSHIIATTNKGVFETRDAGATFTLLSSNSDYVDLEFKPGTFNHLYASTRTGGKIDFSTDGGLTWQTSITIDGGKRVELAVSPANPSVVYALAASTNNGLKGIYKSNDSGQTFTEVFSGTTKNLLGWNSTGTDEGGQGWYDLSITVSPFNADLVLVGGINTWKSTSGGNSWTLVNYWTSSGSPAQTVHADKHNLTYRWNGDLFEMNDGGVYISSADGNSGSWIDLTNGMAISQIYKIGVSQTVEDEVISGLQDNGSKLMSESQWYDVGGGDGMECIIDYRDLNIQYLSLYYGAIYRTIDRWSSREKISPKDLEGNDLEGAWVTPYLLHPDQNNILFAGFDNVYKSTDFGDSWIKTSTINTENKIRSIAICEYAANTMYIADETKLWKSTNGGLSWNSKSGNLPLGGSILSIAIKADDPNILWITLGGYQNDGVYQSLDGGDSWVSISAGLPQIPIRCIVQNKMAKNSIDLYAGTEAGVYYKAGTADWIKYSDGLPNVIITELEIYYNNTQPEMSKLIAGTYGRGLWEAPIVTDNNFAPFVITNSTEEITSNSARLSGSIVYDYGSEITECGFIYSSNSYPVIGTAGSVKVLADNNIKTGNFTAEIDNLISNKTYYVRSYAQNNNGISYGKAVTFTTLLPSSIEQMYQYGIKVFPNPAKGKIYVEFDQLFEETQILIRDISGRIIKSKKIKNKLESIDLDKMQGIYLIEVSWSGKKKIFKILIEK